MIKQLFNRPARIPYLPVLLLLLLYSCQPVRVTRLEEESFDKFYDQFHEDRQFQLDRVRFPLGGGYEGGEGEKEWTRENWEMHKQKVTEITEPDYDTELIRKEKVVIDKVRLRESGFSIERRFELINGKWYLVYYETVNL